MKSLEHPRPIAIKMLPLPGESHHWVPILAANTPETTEQRGDEHTAPRFLGGSDLVWTGLEWLQVME